MLAPEGTGQDLTKEAAAALLSAWQAAPDALQILHDSNGVGHDAQLLLLLPTRECLLAPPLPPLPWLVQPPVPEEYWFHVLAVVQDSGQATIFLVNLLLP